jgi:thiazole/oxazole-forming peptide maturase SagD family component
MPLSSALRRFAESRYKVIGLPGEHGAAVYLAIAIPIGGNDPGAAFLPLAARLGSGRTPSGRGLTPEAAGKSAIGEAAQLVSSSYWGNESTVFETAGVLKNKAVLPNEIGLFSEQQYKNRLTWNLLHGNHDWIGVPFDSTRPTYWVEYQALDGRTAFIPAACSYIGWYEKADSGAFFVADTNGTAAGENISTARTRAFLELVERDATALWWHGAISRPGIEPSRLAGAGELLAWLGSRRRKFHVLDLGTDLCIPVFAAISAEPDGSAVALGFAADFDPSAALLASLTELIQMEKTIEIYRQNQAAMASSPLQQWVELVTLESAPHLMPQNRRKFPLDHIYEKYRNEPAEPLQRIWHCCQRSGLDAWFLDMTRPEISIPVVRAVVPGLRHFKARFAPGRLYDIPVSLGWRGEAMTEQEIFPVPLML